MSEQELRIIRNIQQRMNNKLNRHLLLNSKYTISEYNEVYEVRTALLTNHDVETQR